MAETNTKDLPDVRSPAVERMAPKIQLIRDVYGGTASLRAARTKYLPQHPAEELEDYDFRLQHAVLYNAVRRTVQGLSGLVFRKDLIATDDMDPVIEEHCEDIDRTGRDVTAFARQITEEALLDSLAFIVVDYPSVDPNETRTLADQRSQDLRPYWVLVPGRNFVSARFHVVKGLPILSQFVYRETATKDDGTFLSHDVERFRVLRPGSWEVWEPQKDSKGKTELMRVGGGTSIMPGNGPQEVPVAPVYARQVGHFEGDPPLSDLAEENLAHWRLRADHLHALHVANVPIPIFVGRDVEDEDSDLTIGVGHGINLPEGASAFYLEWTGSSIAASREELKDIETRMAVLGLSMLMRETRAAETAEAKSIDKASEDSALAAFASSLEDGLAHALELHARWIGSDRPGMLTVNRDYLLTPMDSAVLTTMREMVASGQLSLETLWEKMVEGELLPETFDPDLERMRIEATYQPQPVQDDPFDQEDDDEDEPDFEEDEAV